MSLLIRGGQILAGAPPALARADVLVESDRITGVGPALAAPAGAREIDASGHIVLPGLANAHTHAASHLVRGRAGNWTLEDLLTHIAANYGFRTPEDEYLSAAVGAIEMLKTGCTAAYDLYMSLPAVTDETFEAVARAYADVGVRVVLAPAVADIVFYQTVPGLLDLLPPDLRRTVRGHAAGADQGPARPDRAGDPPLARRGRRARPRRGGADHPEPGHRRVPRRLRPASRASTASASTRIWPSPRCRRSRASGAGARASWPACRPRRPRPRLRRRALRSGSTDDDMRMLADAGAAVAHNPGSNLRLGCGIAPVREMLDRGLAVGLGTDGSVCADNQNLFEALRIASVISTDPLPPRDRAAGSTPTRCGTWPPPAPPACSARRATWARSRPGGKADLVLLRADSVFLRPLADPVNALVYAETGAAWTRCSSTAASSSSADA